MWILFGLVVLVCLALLTGAVIAHGESAIDDEFDGSVLDPKWKWKEDFDDYYLVGDDDPDEGDRS